MKTMYDLCRNIDALDEYEMNKNLLIYKILENLTRVYGEDKIGIVKRVKGFFPEWAGNMIEFFRTKNLALLSKFNKELN